MISCPCVCLPAAAVAVVAAVPCVLCEKRRQDGPQRAPCSAGGRVQDLLSNLASWLFGDGGRSAVCLECQAGGWKSLGGQVGWDGRVGGVGWNGAQGVERGDPSAIFKLQPPSSARSFSDVQN